MRELRIPHANSQTQPYVTVSIGVVSVDAYRVATHDVAVALADQALYAAKHEGRDRYVAMEHGAEPRRSGRDDRAAAARCRRSLREACW